MADGLPIVRHTAAAKMERQHPNDPLHGITLKALLEALVARHGWPGLASRIEIRCFSIDPSIKSSLIFLRRNQWARDQVEKLYLEDAGESSPE